MLRPTKSFGCEMIFNSSAVNFGAFLPANCRNPSVYLPSRMTPRKPEFNSRVAISAARTLSGVSNAGTQAAMFSAGPTLVPARPDRLHREAMRQGHMVADLVDVRIRQFEAGGIDAPAIAEIHEPSGFVD